MYLYGPLILVLEILFVIHAIRRGHGQGWIFLILFFPVAGCAVYFVMVMLPEMQGGGAFSAVTRKFNPTGELRRHMENLQETDSVANKARFAEELLNHGKYEDAIKIYEETLAGAFKDDPDLTFGLAKAYYNAGHYSSAREKLVNLASLDQAGPGSKQGLLYAMTLEGEGKTEDAKGEYEKVIPAYIGPEAKCRYAMCLLKSGNETRARQIFSEVVATAKRSPGFYRKLHRQWIDAAKKYAYTGQEKS